MGRAVSPCKAHLRIWALAAELRIAAAWGLSATRMTVSLVEGTPVASISPLRNIRPSPGCRFSSLYSRLHSEPYKYGAHGAYLFTYHVHATDMEHAVKQEGVHLLCTSPNYGGASRECGRCGAQAGLMHHPQGTLQY